MTGGAVAAPASDGPSPSDTWDLVRGGLTNGLGMAGRWSGVIATVAATNLFGAATYGLYDSAWKIALVFLRVARFGLHQGVAREVVGSSPSDPAGAERAIGEGLALALVVGAAAAALIHLVAGAICSLYGEPRLREPLRLMAWALPVLGLSSVLLAATRALRIMKYDVLVHSVGGPLFLLAGTLAAGFAGWGLAGLAGAQLLAAVGVLALSAHYFRAQFSFRACLRQLPRRLTWSALARFSFPVMLSEVMTSVVWSLDQLILLRYAPAASVGVYAAARQASTMMKKAPLAFSPIFGPIVADLARRCRTDAMGEHLAFVLRWVLTANLVLLGVVWLAGEGLLRAFGPEFGAGLQALWVLCLGMVAFGVSFPLEGLLVMVGRPYLSLVNNLIWFASTLALSLWLIPVHGMVGAATASTVSLMVAAAVRLVQARWLLGLSPFDRRQWKPCVAALAAAATVGLCRHRALVALLAPTAAVAAELTVFLAVFGAALYLQGLEREDLLLAARVRRRLARMRS